ncbi:MAG: cell division protein FtsL [Candidatus Aminicenantes bacterium]|nr:cell division protein FtsL [Candidatus Aminicenantes bacterium]
MNRIVLLLLTIMVFISAVEVVYARHQTRKLFVDIQELGKEKNVLDEEWGRLQLEQSTWATDDRIESMARSELNMKPPEMKEIILIKQ